MMKKDHFNQTFGLRSPLTMEISKISGLSSNNMQYDKILTTSNLQNFFKKGSVFSEHVYIFYTYF